MLVGEISIKHLHCLHIKCQVVIKVMSLPWEKLIFMQADDNLLALKARNIGG